jgi:hypothetical protein
MYIIGIDPGQNGGIARIVDGESVAAWPMPKTERDIYDLIREQDRMAECNIRVYIERVHTMPGQGIASSGKFMQHYGFLRGVLVARVIPFEEVSPLKWQRAMCCLSGGDKNVTKGKAQQLFPHLRVTHAIADALLIAEYGRRLYAIGEK